MKIHSNSIVSITEENQNSSNVVLMGDENSEVIVESADFFELTDDEKIDIVAARILKHYKAAFLQLAK